MLNTIEVSKNRKTGNCAQTYRAGAGNMLASCPATCSLNPDPERSTSEVDPDYLNALLQAVPKRGVSFTYSHFPFDKWIKQFKDQLATGKPTTVINFSAETLDQAALSAKKVPTVVALPAEKVVHPKTWAHNETRFVVCPATYSDDVTCEGCGGGVPLCARPERDYVIVFPAHSSSKKLVGSDKKGGCYGYSGLTRLHWNQLTKKTQDVSDGHKLKKWVKTLKPGRVLRHHVVGDIGIIRGRQLLSTSQT